MPALGVVLTAALLIYGVYYRWVDVPQKWLLTREALVALIVVAGLCDVAGRARLPVPHGKSRPGKTALPCAPAANASCCPRISNTANCSSQQAASSTAQTL